MPGSGIEAPRLLHEVKAGPGSLEQVAGLAIEPAAVTRDAARVGQTVGVVDVEAATVGDVPDPRLVDGAGAGGRPVERIDRARLAERVRAPIRTDTCASHPCLDEEPLLAREASRKLERAPRLLARFDEILADDFYCSNPDKTLIDRAAFLKQTAVPVTIRNDRSPSRVGRFVYGMFAMGWRGSTIHWHRYEMAYLLLAGLATPLVISVHTIVSFDFSVGIVPGWHSTIFPPYFVAGAIYAGFAMVLLLTIPLRRFYGLEGFITMRHMHNMAKVMLVTGLIVFYGYVMELFFAWYSGNVYEMRTYYAPEGRLDDAAGGRRRRILAMDGGSPAGCARRRGRAGGSPSITAATVPVSGSERSQPIAENGKEPEKAPAHETSQRMASRRMA